MSRFLNSIVVCTNSNGFVWPNGKRVETSGYIVFRNQSGETMTITVKDKSGAERAKIENLESGNSHLLSLINYASEKHSVEWRSANKASAPAKFRVRSARNPDHACVFIKQSRFEFPHRHILTSGGEVVFISQIDDDVQVTIVEPDEDTQEIEVPARGMGSATLSKVGSYKLSCTTGGINDTLTGELDVPSGG